MFSMLNLLLHVFNGVPCATILRDNFKTDDRKALIILVVESGHMFIYMPAINRHIQLKLPICIRCKLLWIFLNIRKRLWKNVEPSLQSL